MCGLFNRVRVVVASMGDAYLERMARVDRRLCRFASFVTEVDVDPLRRAIAAAVLPHAEDVVALCHYVLDPIVPLAPPTTDTPKWESVFHGICPACRERSVESQVRVRLVPHTEWSIIDKERKRFREDAKYDMFYDERGAYHSHNECPMFSDYECSRGHRFVVTHYNACFAPGCAWAPPEESMDVTRDTTLP